MSDNVGVNRQLKIDSTTSCNDWLLSRLRLELLEQVIKQHAERFLRQIGGASHYSDVSRDSVMTFVHPHY
jgi:hypothetical protein